MNVFRVAGGRNCGGMEGSRGAMRLWHWYMPAGLPQFERLAGVHHATTLLKLVEHRVNTA